MTTSKRGRRTGAALERSLAINERLLREVMLGKVRSRLRPYILSRAVEVALGALGLVLAAPVVAAHAAEPRYLVGGGALLAYLAAITAMCLHLLAQSAQLDTGGPVAAIQRAIQRAQLTEYRTIKWALLGGVVAWLPAALIWFEALTGVPALALVELWWLAGNLAFGLAAVALGLAAARRYVERPGLSPRARRIASALSGRALRDAAGHLDELSRFEREAP